MRHLSHYIVLFGIFIAVILGWQLFAYDRSFKISIIFALGASYVTWGIVHHWLHRDLYFEIVIEYVAIALLGSLLALSLL